MNDGLIRRSDTLKSIANDGDEHWWYEERINEVPAVDAVEVVYAKWMLDGRCSNCLANPLTTHKTYCPNCGARMDGE